MPRPPSPRDRAPRPTRHGRAGDGFTLIEVVVALALVGVIAAAGTSIVLQLNRSLRVQAARMRADEEAKQLAEWLVFETRGLGGDALRPWEAIVVHAGDDTTACAATGDLPACDGSDRLVVSFVDNTLLPCRLSGSNGANLTVNQIPPPGGGADVCCLDIADNAVVSSAQSPWRGRGALLVDADGGLHPLRLHNRTSSGGDGCAINVPGNLPASLDTSKVPNGTLLGGSQRIYFRAPADDATRGLRKNGLYEFTDADQDSRFDTGEVVLIADNVLDLQVAFGHDRDGDTAVVDRSSEDDEWHGNHVDDVLPATVDRQMLRMLAVGIVVAVPLPAGEGSTSAQIFDGPSRTGVDAQLRATVTRAFLRNIFVFD
jgi:prepilin-type N-terminal cleavage/methylation domain-containing protein